MDSLYVMANAVSAVDWGLLAVLLLSVLFGAWRGVIYEVLSLLSWGVAFVLASFFAADMGAYLPLGKTGEAVRDVAGFGCVFVLTLVACALLISVLRRLVDTVGLRPVDRALGAIFGVVRGVALLMLLVLLAAKTPLQRSAAWQASEGVKLVTAGVHKVVPLLPADIARYVPEVSASVN